MKQKVYLVLIFILCVTVGLGSGVAADDHVTEIEDISDLRNVSDDLDGSYVLVSDIDAYGVGFEPIGDSDNPFTGDFDGMGHAVDGLNVRGNPAGLFAATGDGAVVRNVSVTNSSIESGGDAAGLVVENSGSIVGANFSGYVSGDGTAGGLVVVSDGDIHDSHVSGEVSGRIDTGGLVGLSGGKITDSGSTANVLAEVSAGGLVGMNSPDADIKSSYATGDVTAEADELGWAGGLVGTNHGNVSKSYATGEVNGVSAGGLVGENEGTDVCPQNSAQDANGGIQPAPLPPVGDGTVRMSYATGDITGSSMVGGLVGSNSGTVSDSYAVGAVEGDENVGGVVGRNTGIVEATYTTGGAVGNRSSGALVGSMQTTTSCASLYGSYWVGGYAEAIGELHADGDAEIRTEDNLRLSPHEMRSNPEAAMPRLNFTDTWTADTGPDGYPGLGWHGNLSSTDAVTADISEADNTTNTDREVQDTDEPAPVPGFTVLAAFMAVAFGALVATVGRRSW